MQRSFPFPLAIASAQALQEKREYVPDIGEWLSLLLDNTTEAQWDLRYYAANAYLSLYSLTGKESYLEEAFETALNNINHLVGTQREQNEAYLAPFMKIPAPENASKAEKKEIEEVNKVREKEHARALPPIYEPFLLNCDCFFQIIKEKELTEEEARRIDSMIHENGQPVFLTEAVDEAYWIRPEEAPGLSSHHTSFGIHFDGKTLVLPAFVLSDGTRIQVSLAEEPEALFTDWVLQSVDRIDPDDHTSFEATYKSRKSAGYHYPDGAVVLFEISPEASFAGKPYTFQMEAKRKTLPFLKDPDAIPDILTDLQFDVRP